MVLFVYLRSKTYTFLQVFRKFLTKDKIKKISSSINILYKYTKFKNAQMCKSRILL